MRMERLISMVALAAAGLFTCSCNKTVEAGPVYHDAAKARYGGGSGSSGGGGGSSRSTNSKVVRQQGPVLDDDPTTPEPIPTKDIPPGVSPLRHDKPDEPLWTR
jgi:hypothetical protein